MSSPRLLYKVGAEYSERARAATIEGVVILPVEIREDGRARDSRVIMSVGHGLDARAIKAIKQCEFPLRRMDCKPVRGTAQIRVTFRLLNSPD